MNRRVPVGAHPPTGAGLPSKDFCLPMHHTLTDEPFRIIGESLQKVARAMRR